MENEKEKENGSAPEVPENLPIKRGAIDIQLGNIQGQRVFDISSYVELMQFAKLYHVSKMAPKSLDSIEKVAIGIAKCIELGVPFVTFLQHIAVINGHASVWGAGVLALVQGSGQLEVWEEEETGTPYQDDWTFHCTIQRKGWKPVKHSFTWLDAKKAGFDKPTMWGEAKGQRVPDPFSPWARFPKRMMQWKARGWPLKDQFADRMAGLTLAEDAQDIIDVSRDATGAYAMRIDGPAGEGKAPGIEVNDLEPDTSGKKTKQEPSTDYME